MDFTFLANRAVLALLFSTVVCVSCAKTSEVCQSDVCVRYRENNGMVFLGVINSTSERLVIARPYGFEGPGHSFELIGGGIDQSINSDYFYGADDYQPVFLGGGVEVGAWYQKKDFLKHFGIGRGCGHYQLILNYFTYSDGDLVGKIKVGDFYRENKTRSRDVYICG